MRGSEKVRHEGEDRRGRAAARRVVGGRWCLPGRDLRLLAGQTEFPYPVRIARRDDLDRLPLAEPEALRVRDVHEGLHGNAAMRVDPVLGNTCLEDPVGASAVY